MAEQYSSATLGLNIDTKQFNKELTSTSLKTQALIGAMENNAKAFDNTWGELTSGIKDTKRIVSGILVSQGFYALTNALVGGAAAALTYASNMEQAAISTEYFVQGADKAAKSAAYLKTLNEFAARTPFNTEDAISLSKYMQAVGISMGTTKSFLEVITDTAAATGATDENLQRIVFGLGQMMTKGRIANEEIRQLANANIPIYEILQEELDLTGEQISNIGEMWVDADKAIAAILTGLEKRYDGAADRISDTMAGMADTIVDNTKIIANVAGEGIFDGISNAMTDLRDLTDRYREVVNERGSMGLFDTILDDMDATGEMGNQILHLIGNIRQLGEEWSALYQKGKPLIDVYGRAIYTSLTLATGALSAALDVTEDVITVMEDLGITTSDAAEILGTLYIANKAATWMGTLGQAGVAAGLGIFRTATSMKYLLPASIQANAALSSTILGLGGILTAGVAAAGVFEMLNSSMSGLDTSGVGLASSYTAELEKYEAAYAEYAASIDKYQESFNEPYSSIDDGATGAIDNLEAVEKASSSASKAVQNDWVAAFDEVYDIPNLDDTGDDDEELKLPDIASLLEFPRFVFPDIELSPAALEKFDWENVFDDSIFDDMPTQSWWATFLPPVLLGTAVAGGNALAKKQLAMLERAKLLNRGGSAAANAAEAAGAGIRVTYKTVRDIVNKINKYADELQTVLKSTNFGKQTPSDILAPKMAQLAYTIDSAEKTIAEYNAIQAAKGNSLINSGNITEIARGNRLLVESEATMISNRLLEINSRLAKTDNTLTEVSTLLEEQTKLVKQGGQLGVTRAGSNLSALTYGEVLDVSNAYAKSIIDEIISVRGPRDVNGLAASLPEIRRMSEALSEFEDTVAFLKLFPENPAYGSSLTADLLGQLYDIEKSSSKSLTKLLEYMSENASQFANNTANIDTQKASSKFDLQGTAVTDNFRQQYDKIWSEMNDAARKINALNVDKARELSEKTAKVENARIAAAYDAAIAESRRLADRAKFEAGFFDKRLEQLSTSFTNTLTEARPYSGAAVPSEPIQFVDSIDAVAETQRELRDFVKQLNKMLPNVSTQINDIASANGPELLKEVFKPFFDNTAMLSADAAYDAVLVSIDELLLETEKISPTIASSMDRVAEELRETVKQTQAAAARRLTSPKMAYDAVIQNIVEAASGVRSTAVKNATGAVFSSGDLYAVVRGMDDFGKTLSNVVADIAVRRGSADFGAFSTEILTTAFSDTVELNKALQSTIEAATYLNLQGGSLISGNTFLKDGLLSSVRTMVKDATGEMVLNTTTRAGNIVDALKELSVEVAGGYRSISGEMLRAVDPGLYHRLLAQVYSADSGDAGVVSVLNRDYQLSEDSAARTLLDSMLGRNQIDAVGYRPFSNTAFEMLAGSDANKYIEEVLLPLMEFVADSEVPKLNAGIAADATTLFRVTFSPAEIKALGIKELTAGISEIASYAQSIYEKGLAPLRDIETALSNQVDVMTISGTHRVAYDFNNAARQYVDATKDFAKHVDVIAGMPVDADTITDITEHVGKSMRTEVDNLVRRFMVDTINGVENVAETFSASVLGLVDEIDAYNAYYLDGPLNTDIFSGTTREGAGLEAYRNLLEDLANNPNRVADELISMRSAIDGIYRVNNKISVNAPVNAQQLRGTEVNIRKALSAIGADSTASATELITTLQKMQGVVRSTVNGTNAAVLNELGKLNENTIKLVGGNEALSTAARSMLNLVKGGTLKLAEMSQSARELITIGELMEATVRAPVRPGVILDIETDGFMRDLRNAMGRQAPNVLQVSMLPIDDAGNALDGQLTRLVQQSEATVKALFESNEQLKLMGKYIPYLEGLTPESYMSQAVPLESILDELRTMLRTTGGGVTGWNASNLGSFDIQVLKNLADIEDIPIATDIAEMFRKTFSLQKMQSLSDAFRITVGDTIENVLGSAHDAAVDTRAVSEVYRRILDESAKPIAQLFNANRNWGDNIQKGLLEASNSILGGTKATVNAMDEVVEIVQETAQRATQATRSSAAASRVGDMAGGTIPSITAWQRFMNGVRDFFGMSGDYKNAVETVDAMTTLRTEFAKMDGVWQSFREAEVAYNAAQAAIESGSLDLGASAKNVTKQYRTIQKEYTKAFNSFVENIVKLTNNGMEAYSGTGKHIINVIDDLDDAAKYVAYILDDGGTFTLLNNSLENSADDLRRVTQAAAKSVEESLGLVDEDLAKALNEFGEYNAGLRNIDELSEGAQSLKAAWDDVGNTLVLMGPDSDVVYAGKRASEAIADIAKGLESPLKSTASRISVALGGLGVLDLVLAGVIAGFQNMSDEAVADDFATNMGAYAPDMVKSMAEAGIDIGDLVADSIFNGVSEAVTQEAFSVGIGALIAGGLTLATGGAIAPFMASIAGVAGEIGTSIISGMLGANTASNLYLDDYWKALEDGALLTQEQYAEILKQLPEGLSYTFEEIDQAMRDTVSQQLLSGAGNYADADERNAALYGSQSTSGNSVLDELALTLRTLNALEGTAFGVTDYTASTLYSQLTVANTDELARLSDVLGKTLTQDDSGRVFYDDGSEVLLASNADLSSNLNGLSDAIRYAYVQAGSGELSSDIRSLVDGNEKLQEVVNNTYGRYATEATDNFEAIVGYMNNLYGTNYTSETAAATPGVSASMVEQAIALTEAYNAMWTAQLNEMSAANTTQGVANILSEDFRSLLFGTTTQDVSQDTISDLIELGITLGQGSMSVNGQQEDYTTLDLDSETLRENLAGVTVASGAYTDLDISGMVISAEDIEILANAGIQINGDGTVTLMRAINEEETGSQREIALTETLVADNAIKELAEKGIQWNASSGDLDFGNQQYLMDNLRGASFALDSNFSISEEFAEQFEALGLEISNGYVKITNQEILKGNKSIVDTLSTLDLGNFTDVVVDSFANIDELISDGVSNVIEYAAAIDVGSLLPSELLDSNTESALAQAGIHFAQEGEELVSIITNTGNYVRDYTSRINIADWMKLDGNIRDFLTELLGIEATDQIGNELFLNFEEFFSLGAEGIVKAFVEKPETWALMPEALRLALEESGIVAQSELLALDLLMENGAIAIGSGWGVNWEGLTAKTRLELRNIGLEVDTGLLTIEEALLDENGIPLAVEEGVVVPFAELPEDVKAQLEVLGTGVRGEYYHLKEATAYGLGGIMEALEQSHIDMVAEAEDTVTDLINTYLELEAFKNLDDTVYRDGDSWFSKDSYTKGTEVTAVDGKRYIPYYDENGDIAFWRDETNKEYSHLPSSVTDVDNLNSNRYVPGNSIYGNAFTSGYTSVSQRASGGPADGLTLVGEEGREIALLPDGTMKWVGTGRGGLYDFPAGTQIINNPDSEAIAKYAGKQTRINKMATGSVSLETTTATATPKTADAKDGYRKFMADQIAYVVENIHTAIRGAVGSMETILADSTDTDIAYVIENAVSNLQGTLNSNASEITTALRSGNASLLGTMTELEQTFLTGMGSLTDIMFSVQQSAEDNAYLGSSTDHTGSNKPGGSTSITDPYERYEALIELYRQSYENATSDAMREHWQSLIDAARAEMSSLSGVRGSARGSLITRDALYRAGEGGLNEAIIPLERPDVLQQIGGAIAQNIPGSDALRSLIGLSNGGMAAIGTANSLSHADPGSIAQRVLESVLPAMAGTVADTQSSGTTLNVGVLIAEKQGLKELERRLYTIRQTEATRRL